MTLITPLGILDAWPLDDSDDIGLVMRQFERVELRLTGGTVDLTDVITPLTVLAGAAIMYAAGRCNTTQAEVVFDLRELLTDHEPPC